MHVRATVRTNGVASAVATRPWDMQQAAKSIACGTQVKTVSHGSVQLSVFTAVLSHRPCAVISTAHGMLALASEPPRARLSPSRSARPLLGEDGAENERQALQPNECGAMKCVCL